MKLKLLMTSIVFALGLSACKKNNEDATSTSTDNSEVAQQIGETMASMDESGKGSGTYNFASTFERLAPETLLTSDSSVHALAACGTAGFSSCTNNVITRDFGNCTVGALNALYVNGTVALNWTDASVDNTCQMTMNGHSIARSPNFVISTSGSTATYAVTKTGTDGQKITKVGASTFSFTNDGIRRKFTLNGTVLRDYTTTTTGSIGISGNVRNNRLAVGGTLAVTNNLTGRVCSFSPSAVTWNSSCTCAVSGTWDGTCTDGTTVKVDIKSCGVADFTMDGVTNEVKFDRCQ